MYLQNQNPVLVQGYGVGQQGQQQGFVGQNLQSGVVNSNFSSAGGAFNYRFQPVANAISQGAARQQTGQFFQTSQPINTANAMMYQTSSSIIHPTIDISETQSDLIVACNIQNTNLNDLNLTATEDSLSISAQSFSGNRVNNLHRTIPLPTTIRAEAIEANCSNGMVEIRMPKKGISSRKQLQVNINEQ